MQNNPNSSRPPDIWMSAQRFFGPKVRAVAAGLGPNPFSGSARFLAPYLQPQPSALPKNWNTAQAVHRATQGAPVLQGHLTQPQFAQAAQHDLGPLHGVETTLKAMAPDAEDALWSTLYRVMPGGLAAEGLERGFGNKPGDMEKSFGAGTANSVGSAVRGVGAFGDSATRSVTRLVAGEKGVTDYQRHRAHGDFAPLPSDLFTAIANPLFDGARALKKGVRDTPLTRASETAGNIAPGVAVSIANPYAGAAFFAAQGADSQNQAAVQAGKAGTLKADLGVLGNAGVQGGLGLIPGGKFERFLPRFASPAANAAVRAGARTTAGVASGVSSNVAGNLIEKWTVNPDKDIWDGTPENAIWGGVLGAAHAVKEALPGGRTVPAHERPVTETPPPAHPAPDVAPAPRPAARAAAAIVNHHTLTEAVKTARDSALRRDDPARFQAFTAKAADAADVPPLQVSPDALDSALATPEGQRVQAVLPDLPDRVVAAKDAGTDVSVPAHEYLTHVGPELHDQIAGDVRVGPDAMTPAEAVADHEARVAALQDASADAEAGAPDPEAFRQSRQAVTDMIRQHYDRETVGQLSPDQRARAAELAGHALAVEAGKQGVEPMDLYRQAVPERPPLTGENIPSDLDGGSQPDTVPDGVISDFPMTEEDVPVGVENPPLPEGNRTPDVQDQNRRVVGLERPADWTRHTGFRMPKLEQGYFSGAVGNSDFVLSDSAAEKMGLPYGSTIPWIAGIPDFGVHTEQGPAGFPGEFEVPGLMGDHSFDRTLMIKKMSEDTGLSQRAIKRWLLQKEVDLHHAGGTFVQIVPKKIHALHHSGGAQQLRGKN